MKTRTHCLFIIILACIMSMISGCRKHATPEAPQIPSQPPVTEIVAVPSAITPSVLLKVEETVDAPLAEPDALPESFIAAEQDFEAGQYQQAAESYEKFLYTFPKAPNHDRALFHLGLSLALAGEDRDMRQTEAAFQKLIAEFPQSSYRRQAEWILSLQTRIRQMQSDLKDRDDRIRQLGDELQKLKSIDLERRPSRPE